MREATNQHNIFVCPLICRLCTHAVVHRKFKWYQFVTFARARQTIARRIKKCTMCRTDKRIAQGIQKSVGKGLKRQTQMRAPVHKTAKPSLSVPDDKVETVITVRIRNYETACFFRLDSFCRTNNRAPGRQP